MDIGDLVQFKHDSTCAPKGSLGLIVDQRFLKRMEPGKGGYLLYDVMTFDGRVRAFTSEYIKKVTPDLYST